MLLTALILILAIEKVVFGNQKLLFKNLYLRLCLSGVDIASKKQKKWSIVTYFWSSCRRVFISHIGLVAVEAVRPEKYRINMPVIPRLGVR